MRQPEQAAIELQARIEASIPLAGAMKARIVSFDGASVVLEAPLSANLNDKGTAFAGSLATLVTLAGWCLATLVGEAEGERCEAAVFHSESDFLAPVRAGLRAEAWLAQPEVLDAVRERLRAGKRARLEVAGCVGGRDDPALRFSGRYAVWRVGTQPF